MVQKADGMNYAPQGKVNLVVKPGEFVIAAMHLDHGHIYGQCNGLMEAGATLKWVYEPDAAKLDAFVKKYPQVKVARSHEEILNDPEVKLVTAAAVPCDRGPLGCKVMRHGKDYFTDKTPFTTMAQLEEAKKVAAETKQKYFVYYSERLHVECAMYAGQLIKEGAIGRIVQVLTLGPHRLNAKNRPAWFFKKEQYGGVLIDIIAHQAEQFLHYTGNTDAEIVAARVGNFNNPEYPELEDFGDCMITGANGAAGYLRTDWLNPDGLRTWGDGRTFVLGTEGFMEMRKYINLAGPDTTGEHLYIVDKKGERYINCTGQVGFPFFGEFILDCVNRTENAMTQAHAFKASQLCLEAQAKAKVVSSQRPAK